ncbi:MAG: hypothetical protein WCH86_04640, partial [Kiritimatiellales bacterium]
VTTNFTLSIRTTDNGTPALSATNSATLNIVNQSNYTGRATIAVADSTGGSVTNNSLTISKAFTVNTGNVLVVNLSYRGSTSNEYPVGPLTLGWVTGGGTVTQTVARAVEAGNTANKNYGSAIYYLWNPNTGSGTISGSLPPNNIVVHIISAFTLTGVDTNVSPIIAKAISNTTGNSTIISSTTNVPVGGFAALSAASAGTANGAGFSANPAGDNPVNWFQNSYSAGYWDQGYISGLSGSNTTFSCAFTGNARMHIVAAVFTPAVIVPPATYTLTANAGLGGTISPENASVSAGGSTNFVITASNYYRIASLTTNGTAVTGMTFDNNSTTTNFTWSNVQTSGVLAATFTNVLYTLTVNNGTGSGSYTNGQQVTITASNAPLGKAFDKWVGDTQYLAGATVTMPATNITLTATYVDLYYALTVNGGTGGGTYTNGQQVTVAAHPGMEFPLPWGLFGTVIFDKWTGATAYVSNVYAPTTTVTMLAMDITVTATYTTNIPPMFAACEWLAQYGITNNQDTAFAQDLDGDGVLTEYEYIAGTNPTNAASVLKAAQNTRNVITWSAVSGRVYSVYWSTNLVNGFQPLETNIPWTQGSFTNLNPGSRVNLYQIKVRMQ